MQRIVLDVECDNTTRDFVTLGTRLRGCRHEMRYRGFVANLHLMMLLWHYPCLFSDNPEPDAPKKKKDGGKNGQNGGHGGHAGGDGDEESGIPVHCVHRLPNGEVIRNCNIFIENVPRSATDPTTVARRVHFIFYNHMARFVKGLRNLLKVFSKSRNIATLKRRYEATREELKPWLADGVTANTYMQKCVTQYMVDPSEDTHNITLAAIIQPGSTQVGIESILEPYTIPGILGYYMSGASVLTPGDIHPDYLVGSNYPTSGPATSWFPDASRVYQVKQMVTMSVTSLFCIHVPGGEEPAPEEETELSQIQDLTKTFRGMGVIDGDTGESNEMVDKPAATQYENLCEGIEREFETNRLETPAERRAYCIDQIQRVTDAIHAPYSMSCASILALSKFIRGHEARDDHLRAARPWFFMDFVFSLDRKLTPFASYIAHLVHTADSFGDENAMHGNFELLPLIILARDSAFHKGRDLRDNHCLHGPSQTGKSTTMKLTKQWSVPGTVEIIGRQTPQAVTAAVNHDYMFHAFDEMPEGLFGSSGPGGAKTGNATMKVAMTEGEMKTLSVYWDNGRRIIHCAHAKTNITYLFNTNDDATKELDESFQSRAQINYCTRTKRTDKDGTSRGHMSEKRVVDYRAVKMEQNVHCLICVVHLMIGAGFLEMPSTELVNTYLSLYIHLCESEYGISFGGRHVKVIRKRFVSACIRDAVLQYFVVEADTHSAAHPRWPLARHMMALQPYLVCKAEHFVFVMSTIFKYTFKDEQYMVMCAIRDICEQDSMGEFIEATDESGIVIEETCFINGRSDRLHDLSPRLHIKVKERFGVEIDTRYITSLLYKFLREDVSYGGSTNTLIRKGNAPTEFFIWRPYLSTFTMYSSARKCLRMLVRVMSHDHRANYKMLTGITYNYLEDVDTGVDMADMPHYVFYSFTLEDNNQTDGIKLRVPTDAVLDSDDRALHDRAVEIVEAGALAIYEDLEEDLEERCARRYSAYLGMEGEPFNPTDARERAKEESRKRNIRENVYPEMYLRANKRLRGSNEHGMQLEHVATGEYKF